MRTLNMGHPVSICLEAADHAAHMMAKFFENPRLMEMSRRMGEGGLTLENAERTYQAEKRASVLARLDASYENYTSDRCLRRVRKQIEAEDGHRGGRVMSLLFTDGSTDFSRIQGKTQVDAMRTFEGRLLVTQDVWPGATVELGKVVEHRIRYEVALAARDDSRRRVKDALSARNAAKERLVQLYAEIASLVRAEFPRNRRMQELFFLDLRRPQAGTPEDDLDEGDDLPELPEDPEDELDATP